MKIDSTPLLLDDATIKIPYGNGFISFKHKEGEDFRQITPNEPLSSNKKQREIVNKALNRSSISLINGEIDLANMRVAIAVNDQTRPMPNEIVLPPLLEYLLVQGIQKENRSTIRVSSVQTFIVHHFK